MGEDGEDGEEELAGLHLRELVGKLIGMGDMLLAVYMLGLKHRPKKVGAVESPKHKDKSSGGENKESAQEEREPREEL